MEQVAGALDVVGIHAGAQAHRKVIQEFVADGTDESIAEDAAAVAIVDGLGAAEDTIRSESRAGDRQGRGGRDAATIANRDGVVIELGILDVSREDLEAAASRPAVLPLKVVPDEHQTPLDVGAAALVGGIGDKTAPNDNRRGSVGAQAAALADSTASTQNYWT